MLKVKKQINYVAVYPWMLCLGIPLNVYELYLFAYIYNLNTYHNRYLLFSYDGDEDDEIIMDSCKYLRMEYGCFTETIKDLEEKGLIISTKEEGRTYYCVREDLL